LRHDTVHLCGASSGMPGPDRGVLSRFSGRPGLPARLGGELLALKFFAPLLLTQPERLRFGGTSHGNLRSALILVLITFVRDVGLGILQNRCMRQAKVVAVAR